MKGDGADKTKREKHKKPTWINEDFESWGDSAAAVTSQGISSLNDLDANVPCKVVVRWLAYHIICLFIRTAG